MYGKLYERKCIFPGDDVSRRNLDSMAMW
jgi:hypothetical protein